MKILHYFYFTRSERIGAVLLLFISTIIYVIPEVRYRLSVQEWPDASVFRLESDRLRMLTDAPRPNGNKPDDTSLFMFDPNTASVADLVSLGLSEKTAQTIINYRNKGGQFRSPADFKKIWGLKPGDYERLAAYIQIGGQETASQAVAATIVEQPFQFDPNTADENDLKRLNLPSRTIKSILNYRAKGGSFKDKSAFKKIYTLSETDYLRLEPYIQVSSSVVATNTSTNKPSRPITQPTIRLVDVNRASAEQWQSLPGIGETRARQIVNFREKLGGFTHVGQVAETRYLPDSIFQNIRPYLALESGILKPININTIDLEGLSAHPYFSKKQATALLEYRKQHGPYRSVADLAAVIILKDQTWLAKVNPYLTVE